MRRVDLSQYGRQPSLGIAHCTDTVRASGGDVLNRTLLGLCLLLGTGCVPSFEGDDAGECDDGVDNDQDGDDCDATTVRNKT